MGINQTSNQIVVALYGGLGNQLFQYSTARALAERSSAELVIDLEWFDKVKQLKDVTHRHFALAPFNLNVKILSNPSHSNMPRTLIDRIKNAIFRQFPIDGAMYTFNERAYTFDEDVLTVPTPVRLNGYWQSYKYFSDFELLLKNQLSCPQALSPASQQIMEHILSSDSICIHVRRGDYVTNINTASFHGTCDLTYYEKGLQIVSKGLDDPKCFVFTDDPAWAKKNMTLGLPMTVVDVNGPEEAHQDLWLMSACKHFIIANSTLSWWGAWLARYEHKIVIAPAQWFLSNKQDTRDLIPANWIRL